MNHHLDFTLEQLCRALAAHALLVARAYDLNGFFAPEIGEQTAEFIFRFAKGETVVRPAPASDDS
jgi:hypothetical protein